MKILVLMKRFGTNKDFVMQNFGRQVRLFEHIRKFGNDVDFLCMDYKKFESKKIRKNEINYYIEPFSLSKFGVFLKKLDLLLSANKYDIIVASTSPILGIIGYFYSRKYNIRMLYELQDSFDVYGEYKIPFVKQIDKHVTKNSDIVVCVSHTLMNKVKKFRKKATYVIENGVERNLFKPLDKIKCRKSLGLPLDAKIIVYIGHITKLRGFDNLLAAFNNVRKKYYNSYLLVSGQIDKDMSIKHENVLFKALPERKQVVMAINAGDVAVIPDSRNAFTEYSFPYKLVEYMACGIPIVATDIGDMSLVLRKYYGSICKPDDADDLSKKIIMKLENNKKVDYGKDLKKLMWETLAAKLNEILTNY